MSDRTITLHVHGMTCGGCEASLVRVLTQLSGVKSATASHARHEAVLVVDEGHAPSDETLTDAVERAGFTRVH